MKAAHPPACYRVSRSPDFPVTSQPATHHPVPTTNANRPSRRHGGSTMVEFTNDLVKRLDCAAPQRSRTSTPTPTPNGRPVGGGECRACPHTASSLPIPAPGGCTPISCNWPAIHTTFPRSVEYMEMKVSAKITNFPGTILNSRGCVIRIC
ncbi:hypothetical protein LZ32DRAFT_123814 [Colletotrichum eremochloae]|nr:hypothetical protein LZ32DRAFT_123814 [Colletotrichum eremochloae]